MKPLIVITGFVFVATCSAKPHVDIFLNEAGSDSDNGHSHTVLANGGGFDHLHHSHEILSNGNQQTGSNLPCPDSCFNYYCQDAQVPSCTNQRPWDLASPDFVCNSNPNYYNYWDAMAINSAKAHQCVNRELPGCDTTSCRQSAVAKSCLQVLAEPSSSSMRPLPTVLC